MYEPRFNTRGKGVPILKDADIDFHAEAFLKEYNPRLLTEPQPVDIEDFAGYYLGLETDYTHLSHCGLILGRMVFNDTNKIPVFVPEEGKADYISSKKGTIIIDNSLLEESNEYRLRSTMGHECGHWIFHPGYYMEDCNQMNFFNTVELTATACRKVDIEGDVSARRILSSDHDWLEHHAKYFSAAILMPKTAFVQAASNQKVRQEIHVYCDGFCEDECLANHLSNIFQVSVASAKIRLKQLGVSMDVEYAKSKQAQRMICYDQLMGAL
ncbi:MAG: ImmA/IrrE family metallo-endopeptidase [Lachnospiraceae bacterium]